MKAKWTANKPKLKACRKEVKAKGLAGDDRWFYIEDCMVKTELGVRHAGSSEGHGSAAAAP